MKQSTYYALLSAVTAIIVISNSLHAQQVDLGLIQKHRPVRYVAIGGSLSAGVVDGGINMDSQVSAFPNLLARQMGIDSFNLPLIEGVFAPDEKLPKVSGRINNLAVPYLKARELATHENESGAFLPDFDKESYRHLNRYIEAGIEGNASYISVIKGRLTDIDFFTWELGTDDFIEYFSKGAYNIPISFVTSEREGNFPENEILKELVLKGAKGVIANVPEIQSFPVYHFYKAKGILENTNQPIYIQRYGKNDVRPLDASDLLLPTETIGRLSLNSTDVGLSEENPIPDDHVIGHEEFVQVNWYNQLISGFAKQHQLPVVDLHGLYEQIFRGKYISHDGVSIDPSYPDGNFFSVDGVHLSAVGQAVIANEFIRTINSGYGSQIPLVSIKSIR